MTELPEIQFESKLLRQLRVQDWTRLRSLTAEGSDSYMRFILREHPRHVRCFLARRGESILGWSLARWFAPLEASPRHAHISLFVDPVWRRHGLGRTLLDQALQFVAAHRLIPWAYAETRGQVQFFRACTSRLNLVFTPFPLH